MVTRTQTVNGRMEGVMQTTRWRQMGALGAAAWAAWACTGCASILGSSKRTVNFTSEPAGATVRVIDPRDGRVVQSGQTPVKMPLSTAWDYFEPARYRVEYSKPGHWSCASELRGRLSLWYPGNLVFGWIPGLLVVDPLTGAMWRLDRHHHGNLAPVSEPSAETQRGCACESTESHGEHTAAGG